MKDVPDKVVATEASEDYGDTFKRMLERTLAFEAEIGNYGVKQSEYNAYRKRLGLPIIDVSLAPAKDVAEILYKEKYLKARCNEMPEYIAFEVFDAAVNSGVANAIKFLQKSLGLVINGHACDHTIEVVNSDVSALKVKSSFCQDRWKFYLKNPKLKGVLRKLGERCRVL